MSKLALGESNVQEIEISWMKLSQLVYSKKVGMVAAYVEVSWG